jgi:molecular chaperone DnaK (HSP70)
LKLRAVLPLLLLACSAGEAPVEPVPAAPAPAAVPTSAAPEVALERPSPVTASGRLSEDVGIETAAGVFTAVLERGCAVPCETTASFGTAEEGQEEILIFVFRGTTARIDDAVPLGAFEITGFPPAVGEGPDIAVTFRARADGLFLSAEESTGLPIRLGRL